VVTAEEPVYYSHDAASRITTIVGGEIIFGYGTQPYGTSPYGGQEGAGTTEYEYDVTDNLLSKKLPNGCVTYFNYDELNRVSLIHNCLADLSPLAYFEYTYDDAGRITTVEREGDLVVYYGYDDADRLTSENWKQTDGTSIYAFEWQYDAVGNRTYEKRASTESYYSYDDANQLLQVHELPSIGTYFAYDSRGNCLHNQNSGGTVYFTYNDVNLVTEIKYEDETMNYFYYDALMRRYAMEDSSGLRYFTWDSNGMNLLAERDSSGTVTAEYAHGYTPINGIGSLVAAKQNAYSANYYQYPVYDHRGTVVRLVDETGTTSAYYEYDAWGNPLEATVSGGISENRFRYQSNWIELKDSSDSLYLSPTRLYHPEIGRFLGRDWPYGLGSTFYYAGGNPAGNVDPDGAAEIPVPGTETRPLPKPLPKSRPPKSAEPRRFWRRTMVLDGLNQHHPYNDVGGSATGVVDNMGHDSGISDIPIGVVYGYEKLRTRGAPWVMDRVERKATPMVDAIFGWFNVGDHIEFICHCKPTGKCITEKERETRISEKIDRDQIDPEMIFPTGVGIGEAIDALGEAVRLTKEQRKQAAACKEFCASIK
jgi:RHS repeat-associated protein